MRSSSLVLVKIKEDLRQVWGVMADHIINENLENLGLKDKRLTVDDVEVVINTLDKHAFAYLLDPQMKARKTRLYMKWLKEARVPMPINAQ